MRQLKITKQITNRESQSLEKYFQEISKVDMITAEESGYTFNCVSLLNDYVFFEYN